jgi:hypothetical protein
MIYIGVKPGQEHGYSGIALVETAEEHFRVRFLERAAPGTPYARLVEQVVRIALRVKPCAIVVEERGVGEQVIGALQREGLGCEVTPVRITDGGEEPAAEPNCCVPKVDLTEGLKLLLEANRLHVARMSETPTLVREMLNVTLRVEMLDGKVRISVESEGDDDDLVLAVALACWRAQPQGEQRLLPAA